MVKQSYKGAIIKNILSFLNLANKNQSEIRFGEYIFLLYLLVLIRQYAWIISNNVIAWVVTVIVTVSIWYIFIKSSPLKRTNPFSSITFWVIVICPIFLFFILRLPFVDTSYDVLNYHLMASIKSLNGTLFDFKYPMFIFNTLPDMLFGIFRFIFGYRLGTIINILVVLWLALELDNLLEPIIKNDKIRYIAIITTITVENILFELNTGMVDLFVLPLLVRAICLLQLFPFHRKKVNILIPYMAFLLGLALAFKYTSITAIIPIVFVCVYILIKNRIPIKPSTILYASILFIIPLIPYSVGMFYKTHNPVFPLYNTVFHSPYWPSTNFKDMRWGPKTIWEAILWPVLSVFKPGRISELVAYSGKMATGFILSFLLLFNKKTDKQIRLLSFILITGAFLWSITTGYIRYALFFEVISNIIIVYTIYYIATLKRSSIMGKCILITLICIFQFQLLSTLKYSLWTEWSQRPTFFDKRSSYMAESKFILNDRNLESFMSSDEKQFLYKVDEWVTIDPLTSGIESSLKPQIPVNDLKTYLNAPKSGLECKQTLFSYNKKIYTLCYKKNLPEIIKKVNDLQMGIGEKYNFTIPFYSYNQLMDCILLEIVPNGKNQTPILTAIQGPLTDNAYKANISSTLAYPKFRVNETKSFILKVKNQSQVKWSAIGASSGLYKIQLGNHWCSTDGQVLINDDGRSDLPFDLEPGQEIELPLNVKAPAKPGNYLLEFDMVQNSWFKAKGSQTLKMMVTIE